VPDLIAIIGLLAGVGVGAVLGYAGLSKVVAMHRFASSLPFPRRVRKFAAAAIVGGELVLALTLISGLAHPWAAVGAVILLSGFTLYITIVLTRGLQRTCLCFGERETAVTPMSLLRNALLTLSAALSATSPSVSVGVRLSALGLVSIVGLVWTLAAGTGSGRTVPQ
jgi:hypothetical protein